MDGVQRRPAEHSGMKVALAGPHPEVEVREPPHGEVEGGHVLSGHAAVEDEAGVGAALVSGEEVDDRVSADLLLAVEGHADVHGKRSFLGEQLDGLQGKVGVALVVDRAAAVQVAVADLRLEGIRLPEIERRGRLDVEVAVEEDGRRVGRPGGGRDLADRERVRLRLDQSGLAPRPAHELADPLARAPHVDGVRRVGGDAGDAQPLGELRKPGRVEPVGHARESTDPSRNCPTQATSRSFWVSASACSFFRHWFSIWRTRSRVTLNVRPTSSSVRGCCPSRP